MGLIKAAIGAIGGTLGDQWLDAVKCEDLGNSVLMVRKTTKNGVISKGSRIIVNPGQVALIVDSGNILDGTAEPGAFTFDNSSSPSFFGGDFGGVFKEMWERFKYQGTPAKEQAVYFINSKEIMGNKFGTPAPIPYKDWGHPNFNPRNNTMYPMAVNIKAFGTYTFKVTNPFIFMNNVAGTSQRYTKDMLEDQIRSEFIAAFKNTLAELGSDQYKIEAMDLPHKDDEIIDAMQKKHYDSRINERGLSILSVAVESIKFDEDSEKKIRDYELSDAYTQSGYLAGATGRAMETAAGNDSGAMTGFMGVNMAQNNQNTNNLGNMMAMQNEQAKTNNQIKDTWSCSCGESKNTGKFCASCGKPKPQGSGTWLCSCGTENKGKFCAECGAKKPAEAIQYKCDKCGWEPADKTTPPKFCEECGDIFDENDMIK